MISYVNIMLRKTKIGGDALIILPIIDNKLYVDIIVVLRSLFNEVILYNSEYVLNYGSMFTIYIYCKGYRGSKLTIENDATQLASYDTEIIYELVKKVNDRLIYGYHEYIDDIKNIDERENDITKRLKFYVIRFANDIGLKIRDDFDQQTFHDNIGLEILQDMFSFKNIVNFKFNKYDAKLEMGIYKNQTTTRLLKESMIKYDYAGHLIDTRHLDLYDKMKKTIRYYEKSLSKHLYHEYNINVNNRPPSRAWIKLYEIYTETKLLEKITDETLKTFHVCEAPGNFILSTKHYLWMNTPVKTYDWSAQSLKGADIYDDFGLISKYSTRWDFGDGTGDIMKTKNIEHYTKKYKGAKLVTGDCGVAWGIPNIEKLEIAQATAILGILGKGGNMLFKSYLPIVHPYYVGILYLLYQKFDQLIIYKPIQNEWSPEFYVVCKGFNGISDDEYQTMLKMVDDVNINTSLYPIDKMEKTFMLQLERISYVLVKKFYKAIRRNIYYVDNLDKISQSHFDELKQVIHNKNIEWAERFNIKKLK